MHNLYYDTLNGEIPWYFSCAVYRLMKEIAKNDSSCYSRPGILKVWTAGHVNPYRRGGSFPLLNLKTAGAKSTRPLSFCTKCI